MSSRPGFSMESYLLWNFNITADDHSEANVSVGLAEVFGTVGQRPHLSAEQFAKVVEIFEPCREYIEDLLLGFDEDTQSWRAYAGAAFDCIPPERFEQAGAVIADFTSTAAEWTKPKEYQ